MKVADYSNHRKTPIALRVSYDSSSDLLLSLWILADRESDEALEDLDIGHDWFSDLEAGFSQSTQKKLDAIGSGDVWIALLPLLAETGEGGSIDGFLDFLDALDPADLRFRLIHVHDKFNGQHRDLLADAAEGKQGAVDKLLGLPELEGVHLKQWRESLQYLLEMDPAETRDLIVSTLRGVQQDGFAEREAEFRPFLEADFTSKRALARRLSPERLLELATSGIQFTEEHAQKPIVLMPTMVARPWVVFSSGADFHVLGYPVSEQCLDSDPDAPPQWLVKLYKALGDDRRLRVLRRLAVSDASLAELAEDADIAKSTLHHHLMLLRAAGLVRVHVGSDKRYSLREDTLPDAATYLDHYINGTPESQEGAS